MAAGETASFGGLCGIIDRLLGESGCPWDKAQTIDSLKPDLLEECYEATEAIDKGEMAALCEELGDVMMVVVLLAKKAEQAGKFTLMDIFDGICNKMVSRHSHVFGNDIADTQEDALAQWKVNKNKEKNYNNLSEMLYAVPKTMPALMRASKVQKRAKWKASNEDKSRASQLLSTLIYGAQGSKKEEYSAYLGELLFIIASIAEVLEINAEFSLTSAVEAFINSSV